MGSHHLIREARRRAGLTQSELARRAKTTQSAIARWETGKSQPSLDKLMELVNCCGLELSVAMSERREGEWALLARQRALTPEERLDRMLAGSDVAAGDRQGDGGSAARRFDPIAILAALERHQVRHVVIGALAAALHGSPVLTTDIDVAPATDRDNLTRLAEALMEMHARQRAEDGGAGEPWVASAQELSEATVHRLHTDFGALDLMLKPTGTAGFEDLRTQAEEMSLRGMTVLVAALGDVIRSKEAAGRSHDRFLLPTLRRLLDLADRADGAQGS